MSAAVPMEAVVFDLGGVVFESPLALLREFERRRGLPDFFIASVVGSYGAEDGPWPRLERGELSLAEFCERFDADVRARGQAFSSAEMMRDLAAYATVRHEMIDAIRKIRGAGLRVAALTNNWVIGEDHDAILEPLRAEFDVFVESCKVGMRKPDPRIFDLTLGKVGVPAARAAFLDDMGENLKAARALGLTTIRVKEPRPALEELGRVIGILLV